ncbi:hypothetical protein [Arthrobacter pascens]|uniref:hypothetical protein n=1 Tax=Arthrobacter pascens TaxID=1677 RepID=UPI00196B9F88|nr:hypothetical protein [Arthrobacter pascens]MBN3497288.1 hypothetical protein [Arthrobacter pascens]MDR6558767.1 hypothetical protein [Arthrobacter pascens]
MNSHEHDTSETVRESVRADERPDLRSVHVREDVARSGRCGNVHLATGRTCILPERHHGSCHFVGPEDASGLTP